MYTFEYQIHDASKELALLKFISFKKDGIKNILESIPEDLSEIMVQRIQETAYHELNKINRKLPALLSKKDEIYQLLPQRDQLIRWYARDCLEDQDGRITKRMIELENDYLKQRILYNQLDLWKEKIRSLMAVLKEFCSKLEMLEKEYDDGHLDDKGCFTLLMESYERLVIASISHGGFAQDNIISEKPYEWDSYNPFEWFLYRELKDAVVTRAGFSLIRKHINALLCNLYELGVEYGYEQIILAGKQIDYWDEMSLYD